MYLNQVRFRFYMRICFGAMTRFYWQNDQGELRDGRSIFLPEMMATRRLGLLR
jgi:hypothetical protein